MVGGERARAFGYSVRAREGGPAALSFLSVHCFFSFILFQEVWWLGERERERGGKGECGSGGGRERRLILTIL